MKHAKCLTFLSTLTLLFPLWALGRDKNQHSVHIPDSVQVGDTQLKPGDYKVEWQETGPTVHVRFVQYGRTVAAVLGTLKMHDAQVTQDDILTQTTSANRQVLREIDFGHQKEALAFGQYQSNM